MFFGCSYLCPKGEICFCDAVICVIKAKFEVNKVYVISAKLRCTVICVTKAKYEINEIHVIKTQYKILVIANL